MNPVLEGSMWSEATSPLRARASWRGSQASGCERPAFEGHEQ
jgi:hypothetical protein